MRSISPRARRWKTTMSSMRLRNSGRNVRRISAITAALASSVGGPLDHVGQDVAAHVRRHDDHRVAEVDRAALPVRQSPVIQQLQQRVEHVRVRLLDLVEQHHRVRPPPHRLGQLAPFVVADISRRGADQPRHGVLLHVLGHVDADHVRLVVEQERRQRTRQLGLPHARRAQEDERADGPVGVLQAGARTPNGVGDRRRLLRPDLPPAGAAAPPDG